MPHSLTLAESTAPDPAEVAAITVLVHEAAAVDGFPGLNEAALLHLRHPRAGVVHLLAQERGTLVGYAQLDAGASTAVSTGQIVVRPARRRQGVGRALLQELLRRSPSPLRLWAMGDSPAAQALAAGQHLVATRELLVMTRGLADPLPSTPPPPGTTIRTFEVGRDEDEWLRVNARAFRDHPEQGRLTRADLADRMAESWFDPAGFFLAVSTGATPASPRPVGSSSGPSITGFHWTKQHADRLGEVYVLGVDPSAGRAGLGRALLSRGLTHLRQRGNTSVQLYVEAEHERAVALYAGSGFTVASRDVMYASP
ncbi:MAG TPA: mycothiol synthase [Propionibacteriaceae bacterium]|jgi:mycothiol synthase